MRRIVGACTTGRSCTSLLCPRCRSLLTIGHILGIPARTCRCFIIFQPYFGFLRAASSSSSSSSCFFNFLHNLLHGRRSGIAASKTVDVLIGFRMMSSQGQYLGHDVSTMCVAISDFSFGAVPGGTFIRIDVISAAIKIYKCLGLSCVDIFSKSRRVMPASFPIHNMRGRLTARRGVIGLHRGGLRLPMSVDGESLNIRMANRKLMTMKSASWWSQPRASPIFVSRLRYLEAGERAVFVNAAWRRHVHRIRYPSLDLCRKR